MKDVHIPTWKTPDNYAGFNPVGDWLLYMKTRDSEILTESNFDRIKEDLSQFITEGNFPEPDTRYDQYNEELPSDWMYVFSTSHWACGWVKYLMLREDAPEKIIEKANEIYCAISDYPIYDEDDYSERQNEAMWEYWKNMDIRERIEYCKEAMCSIFSARRDELPMEVENNFNDYGTFA